MTDSADERALRRELQVLAKKREELNNSKSRRTGAGKTPTGRLSVFARLGGTPNRSGRQVVQLKENNTRNTSWRQGKRSNQTSGQSNIVKKQKLHSAVARPEGSNYPEERLESSKSFTTATSPTSDSAQERKQRAVEPYAQKDGIARSRRMFGALMGHLGKAKRQIEKDTDLFKRQDTKQQEAEQREKEQSKNLEIHARQEAEIARLEALLARTELNRSEQIARTKLEHLQMIRKSESQSKFMVTIASPPIYYLPAKHTEETKELVAASMEAHEAKIKASERSHEEKLRKLEAEFATKLEKLRSQLKGLQKGDAVETTGEQIISDKEDDDVVDDCDQDSDRVRKESDEDEHGLEQTTDQSNKDVVMEIEKKDISTDAVSDTEMDGTIEPKSIGAEDDCDAKLQGSDEKEESASLQENAPGTGNDKEASSPQREEKEESKQNDQTSTVGVEKECKVAKSADQLDTIESRNDQKSSPSIQSHEDEMAVVDKMKVTELRAELKKRGLETKGLKAKLVQRLKQSMHEENEST